MRYRPQHKQETRERIVRAASRHFRAKGRKGTAIADLMSKLDLTHGGFYRHFGSKEQLLAEAVGKSLEEAAAKLAIAIEKGPPGNELKIIIERYLSVEHCANPSVGCPIAALVSEIPRYPRSVRLKIDRAMQEHFKSIARFLPGASEDERGRNCLILFSGMAGALNLARVTPDPEKRRTILQAAKDFYIKAFCE
jgi:TetR/AcrR family transcriptional repressor of nem operon